MNSDPGVDGQAAATLADPAARSFLRKSDPVFAPLIDGQPDFHPTEDEMVQVAERWRPYRSLAVSYLFASEFEKGT